MKRCCTCKLFKSLASYHKDKSRKDGLSPQCKCCVAIKMRTLGAAYQKTERGKEVRAKAMKRYYSTEKGKQALARGMMKWAKKILGGESCRS